MRYGGGHWIHCAAFEWPSVRRVNGSSKIHAGRRAASNFNKNFIHWGNHPLSPLGPILGVFFVIQRLQRLQLDAAHLRAPGLKIRRTTSQTRLRMALWDRVLFVRSKGENARRRIETSQMKKAIPVPAVFASSPAPGLKQ